ncbi:MAG: hypothetical protein B6U85_07285 [Desulfurococcales archaeon ex4484_42]|nr:MAG: hypothetical protein B6U85_07285 [Desulfurococcales archaeon ex4484_42]
MGVKDVLKYVLALIYSFIATSIVVSIGIIVIALVTVVGALILHWLAITYGYIPFLILILTITSLIMAHDLLASNDLSYLSLGGPFLTVLKDYAVMTKHLAMEMGISDYVNVYVSPRYLLAAFVCRLCGCFSYGIVLGPLVAKFPLDEARAIIAHELAHIKNGDVCLLSIITLPHRVSGKLLNMLKSVLKLLIKSVIGWIFVPFVALAFLALLLIHVVMVFISKSVSRHLEFRADATAAMYAGAEELARALVRYEEVINEIMKSLSVGDLSVLGSLDPRAIHVDLRKYLSKRLSIWDRLHYAFLSTHPPTEERVKRLLLMAKYRTGKLIHI